MQTTIEEACHFSARLRLPTTVDAPTRQAFVEEVRGGAGRGGGAEAGVLYQPLQQWPAFPGLQKAACAGMRRTGMERNTALAGAAYC